ncbi:MAG: flavodoxin-dependent (E)-4-hydroxy-3-methylbut-2-enyl-diphosphate synthase, partial [Muribaculaceae bacterium]|nr:flavodoxin-dependent (E)-4-hydroxy-3-methylbut-2-enyl-diphosphate synthase [Muribaculaceae bacterium]
MAHKNFRRKTSPVKVGNTIIGGDAPIRLQSMTNTSTLDTAASVAQCEAIAAAGADIVRLTAQGVAQARNMGEIRRQLREKGIDIPLVADIHFNP